MNYGVSSYSRAYGFTDPAQYERWVRAKVGHRHVHVWIKSAAYESLKSWKPFELWFCDVPGCEAVKNG